MAGIRKILIPAFFSLLLFFGSLEYDRKTQLILLRPPIPEINSYAFSSSDNRRLARYKSEPAGRFLQPLAI
jgi:hypothetical protein